MEPWVERLGGIDAATRAIEVAILVAARMAPLTILAPWIALRGTPPLLRAALVLALTVAMMPTALAVAPSLPGDLFSFSFLVAREGLIGTVFAVASAIPLHALDHAGRLIDAFRGASQSESTSPSGERGSPLGTLQIMLGGAIFLALGGHRFVLSALGEGMIVVPPGGAVASPAIAAFALGAARIVVAALTLAVSFAGPVAVGIVAVETALGLAGRAVPQIPLHFLGMPLRAAVGLGLLLLSLAMIVPQLPGLFTTAIEQASALVRALAARAP